jgi:hypothetical protein
MLLGIQNDEILPKTTNYVSLHLLDIKINRSLPLDSYKSMIMEVY